MSLKVRAYCRIENNKVFLNEDLICELDKENLLKSGYQWLNLDYPKFYKMDNLCKLGVIGSAFLEKAFPEMGSWEGEEVGIFLQSEHGSLETDENHHQLIQLKSASPSVFVYTLPNIVVGEISIRYKWHGETAVFINKEANLSTLAGYVYGTFKDGKSKKGIVGHIDFYRGTYKLKLALVEAVDDDVELKLEQFLSIF